MVVYGWKSKVLKEALFNGHQCPRCQNQSTHIVVFGSYFHIFWIPFFPYRKNLKIICDSCQLDQKPKEVTPELRKLTKQLKSQVRLPFYMFSGVGIITLLIGYFAVTAFLDDLRFEKYLTDPKVNDIYYIFNENEPTELKYSLLKVIDIREDSVDMSPNSFGYNYEPSVLMEEDGFLDVYYSYHKNQLRDMYERDELKTVIRKSLENTGMDKVIEYNLEEFQEK